MVRLVVLNDNTSGPGLLNEWGWSIYIETQKYKLLFDADSDYRIIEYNSSKLGVDLRSLDYGILSHWHSDHYGGFSVFARIDKRLTVYTPPGPTRKLERLGLEVRVVTDKVVLGDGVVILPPIKSGFAGVREISASIPSRTGRILVVGCSHPGVDNIAEMHVRLLGERPYMVIGGFHRPSRGTIDRLASIVEGPICAAHCSGDEAKSYIASKYKSKACSIKTGSVIQV